MTFGSVTDEHTAAQLIDVCIDRGLNFFDTANVYNSGRSEEILGRILKGRRDRVILASKVGMRMRDDPAESGLSADAILRSIDKTLQRLQTDHLDIYYLHVPDYGTPIQETLAAMDTLVRVGKIRYPGVSNYAGWQLCQMLWISEQNGYRAPTVSQPIYNLLARGVEQELVPCCKTFGISLVVYNPLARGLLASGEERPSAGSPTTPADYQLSLDRYTHPAYQTAAVALRRIAGRCGRSLVDLALNWLMHHTATDCMILGATDAEQLAQNLDVLDNGPLPADVIESCDAAWQELRGVAPRYNR
jgi:aryl-alcohol dehydrogenase-like predicted oxidoreductase